MRWGPATVAVQVAPIRADTQPRVRSGTADIGSVAGTSPTTSDTGGTHGHGPTAAAKASRRGGRSARGPGWPGWPVRSRCSPRSPSCLGARLRPGRPRRSGQLRRTVSHAVAPISLTWQQTLPDAGGPIAESLALGGHPRRRRPVGGGRRPVRQPVGVPPLATARRSGGWPAHTGGAPIDSTPSVRLRDGSGHRQRLRRRRQRRQARVGGYYAFNHAGPAGVGPERHRTPTATTVCRPRWRSGTSAASPAVVAPSLGQDEYALNAANGGVLPGLAVLHRRQRLHHAVAGRPLRQRPDRGRRGRRLVAGPGLRPDLHRRRPPAGARRRAAT